MLSKYKNKIKELEKDLSFWQTTCKELQKNINTLEEENKNLKNINTQLNNQLMTMNNLSQENEIMRKYYKVDEEPSPEIQAKILVDLRLHDMEFKILQEKLNECKQKIYFNQMAALSSPIYYSRYY